jgi:hypothetical protein
MVVGRGVRSVIRCAAPFETTISSTGRWAGTVTVGGLTAPPGRIVNRAGTRTLIEPVAVVAVVFVMLVVDVRVGAVRDVVVGVRVGAVRDVVVDGEEVAGAVCEAVGGAVGEDAAEVDFEPPQPATTSTPKRTAIPLTFAG